MEPPNGCTICRLTADETEEQGPEIEEWLEKLTRKGAYRMILTAPSLEVEQYVQALRHIRDEQGHAMVVPTQKSHYDRTANPEAAQFSLRVPRVNDRRR